MNRSKPPLKALWTPLMRPPSKTSSLVSPATTTVSKATLLNRMSLHTWRSTLNVVEASTIDQRVAVKVEDLSPLEAEDFTNMSALLQGPLSPLTQILDQLDKFVANQVTMLSIVGIALKIATSLTTCQTP